MRWEVHGKEVVIKKKRRLTIEEGVDDGGQTSDGARPPRNSLGVDYEGQELVHPLTRAHQPHVGILLVGL